MADGQIDPNQPKVSAYTKKYQKIIILIVRAINVEETSGWRMEGEMESGNFKTDLNFRGFIEVWDSIGETIHADLVIDEESVSPEMLTRMGLKSFNARLKLVGDKKS